MEWDSPWGKGFPGWHLECSVMARQLLGDQIDIHTGGIDHIPVHHTNEIAQTEAITGKKFANYWLHANHLKINGTKIAKSLGNGYTLKDILDKGYVLPAFKVMVLSKHYRTEGNFTWKILEAAQNRLSNWQAAADLRWQRSSSTDTVDILGYLQNDLDTPGTVAAIDGYFEKVNSGGLAPAGSGFGAIEKLLGVELLKDDITDAQKALIKQRQTAKDNKDFEASDKLRDQLGKLGIEIRDTPQGPIWFRV